MKRLLTWVLLMGVYFWAGKHSLVEAQMYTNSAEQLGIDVSFQSTDNFGAGVSFFDINQDGFDDLTFALGPDGVRCFTNQNGSFEEEILDLPELNDVRQVLWFDYNNDGIMDLLISPFNAPYKLFRNLGDFQFIDVSFEAGLNHSIAPHCGLAVSDYNKDGYLDFYVSVYSLTGDGSVLANNNQLYQNNGDGTFTNATIEAGVGGGIAASFASIWMDYNNDGWPDLYVSNDRIPFNNVLYENNGDGTFTDVTEQSGTGFAGQYPMTTTVGDYDNDGDLDIYLTNIGNFYFTELLSNNGDGSYTPKGQDAGVQNNIYSWGGLWVDHDNDGLQDLYVATSPTGSGAPVYKDVFYAQVEGGTFSNQTNSFQDMPVRRTYAVARGDLNNDGFPDIATHSIAPFDPVIWKNNGGSNSFVKISLQGTASNPMAIGSWIRVFANGLQYSQYTMCGENYLSQCSQYYTFGLGNASVIDSIQVEYLSGHSDWYYSLQVNESYEFTEGETYGAEISPTAMAFCPGGGVWLNAGAHEDYNWSNGENEQVIYVDQPGAYVVEVMNEFGVTAVSDTVNIIQYPDPFVVESIDHPLCFGEQNASVLLENLAGVPADSVYWNGEPGDTLLFGVGEGLYSYHFVDSNGCVDSGMAAVIDPELLSGLLFTTPEITDSDGSIVLVINGGTPPYQVFLDSVEVGMEIEGLSAGIYQVLIIDAHNCSLELEANIAIVTSLEEEPESDLLIFPNPVQDKLFLPAGQHFQSVRIYDLAGNEMISIPDQSTNQINVENLSKGVYLLRLIDENDVNWTYRFVKR